MSKQLHMLPIQFSHDVNFVWRLAKATHFQSKVESQHDRNEEKRLAYSSRDLAAISLRMNPDSAAANKWSVSGQLRNKHTGSYTNTCHCVYGIR